MTRTIGSSGPVKVVIADDAGLIYSDDWRNGWKTGFNGISCEVRVVDISQLRRAVSAGPFSARSNTVATALADAVIRHRPDLVWCHHGRAASSAPFLQRLRRAGIRTAVYLCDEPYEVGETARYSPGFDFVFSMDFCTVETHRAARHPSERASVFYLPPCADETLFEYRSYAKRSIPAFFLGNPTLVPREPWLRAVQAEIPGADIRYWPVKGRPVAKGSPAWIPANEHPNWYGRSIVGLNIHRDPAITAECFRGRVLKRPASMAIPQGAKLADAMPKQDGTGFWNDFNLPASHVNPRFFEFAACGTLVVSDSTRSEIVRMFPFSPRARTKEEFVELVRYYNEHKDEAEFIGRLCHVYVKKYHTYRHRAFEVLTRVGLQERVPGMHASSLGEPAGFLTPQDTEMLEGSSSGRTGLSEQWSPQYGLSLIETYGDPSRGDSLDPPPIVYPW